jgi:hypothetical protein
MALSPESRRRFTNIGLILAPVVLVKVAASILGDGTAGAVSAATEPETIALLAPGDVAPGSAAEIAAARRVRELALLPMGPSPLYYEPRRVAPAPAPAPSPPAASGPEIIVSMVMASKSGSIALINGRPCRVGDAIEGGAWTIIAIDVADRKVELANAHTGERQVARVPMPE